jgi:CDP-diacylglycerol--glycerol-3-phosphate 3-phosphatidyltransferase
MLDLTEEIILVLMLPRWQTDVKGLYWVLKKNQKSNHRLDGADGNQ